MTIDIDPRMSPEAQRLVSLLNHFDRPAAVFLRFPGHTPE